MVKPERDYDEYDMKFSMKQERSNLILRNENIQ